MIKVILLIDCSSEYDRRLLRGLVRYSKENGDWQFYRMPSYLLDSRSGEGEKVIMEFVRKWKADAIAGRWPYADMSSLSKLKIPIVLQNTRSRSDQFSNVTGDYLGAGRIAAEFFIRRRYRNFAFFGLKDTVWSEERLEGFREGLARYSATCSSLLVAPKDEHNGALIRQWLVSLPKPVAIFTCDDNHALTISETSRMEGIHIPDQVSLLGVDNDELICEISDPPISSISLDVEQGGYNLGKCLHEQILSRTTTPFNITIKPGIIIQRASTQRHNIRDPYIARLVKYIDDNFSQEITTAEILAQVPLSRRSVELKFKKEMDGVTLYKYLTDCRIEHFAQLLVSSDLPLSEVASMSGITDYSNFSRIFKKVKGMSPLEYRRREMISMIDCSK